MKKENLKEAIEIDKKIKNTKYKLDRFKEKYFCEENITGDAYFIFAYGNGTESFPLLGCPEDAIIRLSIRNQIEKHYQEKLKTLEDKLIDL